MSAKPRVKSCADCPTLITAKSTRCKVCANKHVNSNPAVAQARTEGIRRKFATDPAHHAKMAAVARRNAQKACADPEYRARLIEHGKIQYAKHLNTPQGRAANKAVRAQAGKTRTETVMAWCPPELRAEYKYWTISRRKSAVEARAIMEAKIADLAAVRSGELGNAAAFLNRFTSVRKLDDGTYRYGLTVMTAGELMKRALAKGFTPTFSNGWIDRLAA